MLAPARAQNTTPTFSAGATEVRVDAQVVQGKTSVKNLNQSDFVVLDNSVPQKVVYFGHDREQLSIVFLLDISGSMRKYIDEVAATARRALGYLQPNDRVATVVFAKNSEVHTEFTANLANAAAEMRNATTQHDVGESTNINQAVLDAARYMDNNAPEKGRHAILIITDNNSKSYQLSDETVVKQLYDADTVLNAIVVGQFARPAPPKAGESSQWADVYNLADATGGEVIKGDDPGTVFAEMVERMRQRYLLVYNAPGGQKGEFRRVTVQLTPNARAEHPAAEIRARKGYYAQ